MKSFYVALRSCAAPGPMIARNLREQASRIVLVEHVETVTNPFRVTDVDRIADMRGDSMSS